MAEQLERKIQLATHKAWARQILELNKLLFVDFCQGYRNRYDIIDHGHEKNTFMCFFHRPIFTKIREFATSVLWKLVVHFGYRGRNCTGVDIIS